MTSFGRRTYMLHVYTSLPHSTEGLCGSGWILILSQLRSSTVSCKPEPAANARGCRAHLHAGPMVLFCSQTPASSKPCMMRRAKDASISGQIAHVVGIAVPFSGGNDFRNAFGPILKERSGKNAQHIPKGVYTLCSLCSHRNTPHG